MKGRFIMQADIEREVQSWGETSYVCRPSMTGANDLVMMVVTLKPGQGHNFHKHERQEEIITVVAGEIEQWLESDKRILRPGDSIFIDTNVVHASFNVGSGMATLSVVLGPADGPGGYSVVDVGDQEPWASLRQA